MEGACTLSWSGLRLDSMCQETMSLTCKINHSLASWPCGLCGTAVCIHVLRLAQYLINVLGQALSTHALAAELKGHLG